MMHRPFRLLSVVLSLFVVAASCCLTISVAYAAKRVALVIGNGEYSTVTTLPNAKNDAEGVADKLRELGFTVQVVKNANRNSLRDALGEFSNTAIGAEIGVVFYAGHGIEVDHQNYLIPVDARLETDLRVRFEAISLDDVLASLEGVTGIRIIMLDACRNNPFISTMKITTANRAIHRGLSKVEPSVGTLVSFSAKEGTTAADGTGSHSPYTTALLQNLDRPGLEVNKLFRLVRDDVLAATGGEQEPYTYGSTSGTDVFLKDPLKEPPASPVSTQSPVPAADEILIDFQLAKDIGTQEGWEAFLAKHGDMKDNFYVTLAIAALQKLQPADPPKGAAETAPPVTTVNSKTDAVVDVPAVPTATSKNPPTKAEGQSSPPKQKSPSKTKAKSSEPPPPKTREKKTTAKDPPAAQTGKTGAKSANKKNRPNPTQYVASHKGGQNVGSGANMQRYKTEYGTIVCPGKREQCRYTD